MFSGYLWEFIAITKDFISTASFRWVFVVGLLHYFTLSGLCFICCMWTSKKVFSVRTPVRLAIFLLLTAAILVPLELHYGYLKMSWVNREVNRGRNFYLKRLVKNGANPNSRDRLDQPMLLKAAYKGNAKIVKTLLSYGAEVDATGNEYQQTALSVASGEGHKRIVEILLAHGADANKKANTGMSPLMLAVGHPEIAEILLKHGADVDAEDDDGYTPLIYAAIEGNADTARILLDNGARVDLRGAKNCNTAFITAAAFDYPEVLSVLKDYGANANATNKYCMTALMLASKVNCVEAVQYLLHIGVDRNLKDATGKTALSYAREKNHTEIANLLEEAGGIE
jgi:ankyrin repeat protein